MPPSFASRYIAGYNKHIPRPADESLLNFYNYVPSIGFNGFACAAFGLLFFAHGFWLARYPSTRGVQGLLMLYCAWQLSVYILRVVNFGNPYLYNIFNSQYVIALMGPHAIILAFLLALVTAVRDPVHDFRSVFTRPSWILSFLKGYQVVTFLICFFGATLWTVGNSRLLRDEPSFYDPFVLKCVLLVGLGNQLAQLTLIQAFLTRILLSLRTTVSVSSGSAGQTYDADRDFEREIAGGNGGVSRMMIITLFLTVGMIWTRTIYRSVETVQDWFGPAWTDETTYAIFEFGTMFTAAAVWAVRPFGHYLKNHTAPSDEIFMNTRKLSDTASDA